MRPPVSPPWLCSKPNNAEVETLVRGERAGPCPDRALAGVGGLGGAADPGSGGVRVARRRSVSGFPGDLLLWSGARSGQASRQPAVNRPRREPRASNAGRTTAI